MPQGQLTINNNDAYNQWGVSLTDTALSALMQPLAMKDDIVNESRLESGRRHASIGAYVQEREINLPIHITARTTAIYLDRLAAFRAVLEAGGTVRISTSFEQGVVYRCRYVSCTQFTQFYAGAAKLMLRLVEPDPSDRGAQSIHV